MQTPLTPDISDITGAIRKGSDGTVSQNFLHYINLRKQKLAALYIQIARQAVQLSSEFYDFL
jgi:hypothetical protein